MVDFVRRWSERTQIASQRLVRWLGVASSQFYDGPARDGKMNEHHPWVRRDFWLEEREKQAIIEFRDRYPREGYRRLTCMMRDQDVVAVSPSSVGRVLKAAGRLAAWNGKPSRQGSGFQQPLAPHQHGHVDISYLNLAGTFYYLCRVLHGYSRYLVHGEIRESMKEAEVEIVLQRAREKFPPALPRIIADNGPQFIARDFKQFIRICGMTPVRTSPFYPPSNGKLERWPPSLKAECIRPGVPLSWADAQRPVARYVNHYNQIRLHSALRQVTPQAKLEGCEEQIFAERDGKLEEGRRQRQFRRQQARVPAPDPAGDASTVALN